MRVRCKLETGIAGIGFTLKRGFYIGDMDERGIVWVPVTPSSRLPTTKVPEKVGVAVSKFSYIVEESPELPAMDKRAPINDAIRAAQAKAAKARA